MHHGVLHDVRRLPVQVEARDAPLEPVRRPDAVPRQLRVQVLVHAAEVEYPVELKVAGALVGRDDDVVVDHQGVLLGGGAADADGVPAVVVEVGADGVAEDDGAVAHVHHVVDVAVDELDGDEVLLRGKGAGDVGRAREMGRVAVLRVPQLRTEMPV